MIRFIRRLAVVALALTALPYAASSQSKPVTLAVQPSTDVPQILLAMERKLWDAEKLEVKVVTFSTGREALEALTGGQADFAVLTEYPATIGILRGQKFKVVADMSRYQGLRATASKKWMTLSSLKDLDGKKVGTTLGTNVEFVTSVLLREGGAKAEIVNAAPADTVPALVRGDIQASVMFPNLYAQAKKLLGADYQEIRTSPIPPMRCWSARPRPWKAGRRRPSRSSKGCCATRSSRPIPRRAGRRPAALKAYDARC